MFFKFKYIIQGYFYWFLSLFKNLKNKKLYSYRLSICNECEHNKKGICDKCGCVVKAKTKSDSLCPINKW